MRKTIYHGLAKDFWFPVRLRKFIDYVGNVEQLNSNLFLDDYGTFSPFVYYFSEYDVVLQYKYEEVRFDILSESPDLKRAQINLFGEKRNIEKLEFILKNEAKKLKGIDDIPPQVNSQDFEYLR